MVLRGGGGGNGTSLNSSTSVVDVGEGVEGNVEGVGGSEEDGVTSTIANSSNLMPRSPIFSNRAVWGSVTLATIRTGMMKIIKVLRTL